MKSTIGLRLTSVFTIQNRRYDRLQTGISPGFQRPTSAHFATTGKAHSAAKIAPPDTSDRR